jgi:hypothetical protein
MKKDGCAWLHGEVVLVLDFDYFFQQKLVIIILELDCVIRCEKFVNGWG